MEDILIRHINEFSPRLIRELCRLEIENLGEEASLNQWVLPVLVRYGLVTLAEIGSEHEIAGICQTIRSYRAPSNAFIHSIYVRPHHRGKHIGSLLLEKVIDRLKQDDLRRVQLTVDPGNKAAVSMYTSAGFKRSAGLRDEYGEGIHRDLYSLEL